MMRTPAEPPPWYDDEHVAWLEAYEKRERRRARLHVAIWIMLGIVMLAALILPHIRFR